jgi:hypothetical protein
MVRCDRSRRCFLGLVAGGLSTAAAGCSSSGGSDGESTAEDGVPPELQGPVADPYETAEGQAGTKRNPNRLSEKPTVNYQDTPRDGESCANCGAYIPDKNGDGLGACVLVTGYFETDDWCAVWYPIEQETES